MVVLAVTLNDVNKLGALRGEKLSKPPRSEKRRLKNGDIFTFVLWSIDTTLIFKVIITYWLIMIIIYWIIIFF